MYNRETGNNEIISRGLAPPGLQEVMFRITAGDVFPNSKRSYADLLGDHALVLRWLIPGLLHLLMSSFLAATGACPYCRCCCPGICYQAETPNSFVQLCEQQAVCTLYSSQTVYWYYMSYCMYVHVRRSYGRAGGLHYMSLLCLEAAVAMHTIIHNYYSFGCNETGKSLQIQVEAMYPIPAFTSTAAG